MRTKVRSFPSALQSLVSPRRWIHERADHSGADPLRTRRRRRDALSAGSPADVRRRERRQSLHLRRRYATSQRSEHGRNEFLSEPPHGRTRFVGIGGSPLTDHPSSHSPHQCTAPHLRNLGSIDTVVRTLGSLHRSGPAPTERRPGGCTRRGVWVALIHREEEHNPDDHHPPCGRRRRRAHRGRSGRDRAEWPLIEAELDLLDAEIAYINAGPEASVLDRRRVRRAERRVLEVSRELANRDPETEDAA